MFSFLEMRKLMFLIALAAIALIGLFVVTRLNGKWVCEPGGWVAKGTPMSAKPTTACY